MVPKLHAKGTSFKGIAAYLLHDKDRADTSERVEWTHTRNVATDDPQKAWRIMAATALDQSRLKAEAGVSTAGRKSDKHVLHFTLSWHPDQTPDRGEMIRAAEEAIKALGAEGHQAMIIAHNDEDHPHLHVVINRVSPKDGKHLSSSNDRLKLSAWAEAYEKKTGIYCENRIINNEQRRKGAFVRGVKDVPRHIFEAMRKAAANDNRYAEALRSAQRQKDARLAADTRAMHARHKGALESLHAAHNVRKASIAKDQTRRIDEARAGVLEAYRPRWRDLNREQRREAQVFEQLETNLFGRTQNAIRTIDLMKRIQGVTGGALLARGFKVLASAGQRRTAFDAAQNARRSALQRLQDKDTARAVKTQKRASAGRYAETRADFGHERTKLLEKHGAERMTMQQTWRTRTAEREAAWADYAKLMQSGVDPRDNFNRAAPPTPESQTLGSYESQLRARYNQKADSSADAQNRKAQTGRDKGDSGQDDRER